MKYIKYLFIPLFFLNSVSASSKNFNESLLSDNDNFDNTDVHTGKSINLGKIEDLVNELNEEDEVYLVTSSIRTSEQEYSIDSQFENQCKKNYLEPVLYLLLPLAQDSLHGMLFLMEKV